MPKIQSVSVCVARVALDNVTSFATRTVSGRDYCLVKVRSTDGIEGIGFCYVGSAGGNIARAAVEELLAQKADRAGIAARRRAVAGHVLGIAAAGARRHA